MEIGVAGGCELWAVGGLASVLPSPRPWWREGKVKSGIGDSCTSDEDIASPLWRRIGVASARANLVPAVVLWTMAAALVAAYYGSATVPEALVPFSRRLVTSGWIAPFLNRVLFCGVVPGFFWVFVPSLRPRHVRRVIVLEMLWNGALGVAGDWCFHLLNRLFGEGHDVLTLLLKTSADQFVWTVVFIAPVNAVFHFWLARDCSFAAVRRAWPKRFYSALVAPNLISNWCVWIPVQLATFTFPVDLQIHVNGIICAFWTLMCLQIGKRSGLNVTEAIAHGFSEK